MFSITVEPNVRRVFTEWDGYRLPICNRCSRMVNELSVNTDRRGLFIFYRVKCHGEVFEMVVDIREFNGTGFLKIDSLFTPQFSDNKITLTTNTTNSRRVQISSSERFDITGESTGGLGIEPPSVKLDIIDKYVFNKQKKSKNSDKRSNKRAINLKDL
jgi:hypothetical protein